jgi:hypothetical protein
LHHIKSNVRKSRTNNLIRKLNDHGILIFSISADYRNFWFVLKKIGKVRPIFCSENYMTTEFLSNSKRILIRILMANFSCIEWATFASVFGDLFTLVVLVPKNWCKQSQWCQNREGPPIFGRSVNPIPTGGGLVIPYLLLLAPPINFTFRLGAH